MRKPPRYVSDEEDRKLRGAVNYTIWVLLLLSLLAYFIYILSQRG